MITWFNLMPLKIYSIWIKISEYCFKFYFGIGIIDQLHDIISEFQIEHAKELRHSSNKCIVLIFLSGSLRFYIKAFMYCNLRVQISTKIATRGKNNLRQSDTVLKMYIIQHFKTHSCVIFVRCCSDQSYFQIICFSKTPF